MAPDGEVSPAIYAQRVRQREMWGERSGRLMRLVGGPTPAAASRGGGGCLGRGAATLLAGLGHCKDVVGMQRPRQQQSRLRPI